jgi:hypothetical protein
MRERGGIWNVRNVKWKRHVVFAAAPCNSNIIPNQIWRGLPGFLSQTPISKRPQSPSHLFRGNDLTVVQEIVCGYPLVRSQPPLIPSQIVAFKV